jgi:hypothetical protein
MTAKKPEASNQARDIIAGLMQTGRGSDPQIAGAYVRLLARIAGFYWVRIDGGRPLRGHNVDDAEQLQVRRGDGSGWRPGQPKQ